MLLNLVFQRVCYTFNYHGIGWKSGKTTCIPLWDRKKGAWLSTRKERAAAGIPFGFDPYVFGPPGSGP
jgi:hypothetical protein